MAPFLVLLQPDCILIREKKSRRMSTALIL